MVSPYKTRKIERRGRVDVNPPKNNLDSKGSKSSKPLSNKKFYLDIKNHSVSKKLESKLTSLGAKLELFLDKEVYCVVTDRDDYFLSKHKNQLGRNTPRTLISPSPFCSISPVTNGSPGDGVISKRTRSRAEAMLEKVKQQPQKTSINILDSASSWGIPIYPYTKFVVWLEKVSSREEKNAKGIKELKGNFLKLETGGNRPDFRQFRIWPKVACEGDEQTAFPRPLSRFNFRRMRRKGAKQVKDSSVAGGNGYCEMCQVHYDQLDNHIISSQHIRYASDSANFIQLDSLISRHELGNIGSLRKSLRIAKSPPVTPVEITRIKYLPAVPVEPQIASPLNCHITRSKSDKVLCNGLSPDQEKRKSSLRSGVVINNLPDKKEEHILTKTVPLHTPIKTVPLDTPIKTVPLDTPIKTVPLHTPTKSVPLEDHLINLRSRNNQIKSSPPVPLPCVPKRNRLSKKRLSVEEKLIEDNKTYYKVEVLNSKLRSTEYFINQKHLESKGNNGLVNGNCVDLPNGHEVPPLKNHEREKVVVRFKKVRRSQLALLSDEAENFMFGDSTRKDYEGASSCESCDSENSDASESAYEVTPKKKSSKISSQSESAINNNKTSPLTSPKLKSQSTLPGVAAADVTSDDVSDENLSKMILNCISYSFENPIVEPWMEVSKRREENKNLFYHPHHHDYPKVVLPSEYSNDERSKFFSSKKFVAFGKRKDKTFQLLTDEGKARKSPRCHASTLAIMSSLMRRRPMRECTSNLDFTYEEESRSSLPETVESSCSSFDYRAATPFNREIELPVDPTGDVFATALTRLANGETSTLEIGSDPCLPVNQEVFDEGNFELEINLKPGLMVPLEDIINQQEKCGPQQRLLELDLFRHLERDKDSGSDCSDLLGFTDDGRVVTGKRRKRKRNMTGWPIEKPKKKIKKEVESSRNPLAITCEPCSIKLEAVSPEILEKLANMKQEPYGDEVLGSPFPPIMKRGRGRPRKYPLSTIIEEITSPNKSSSMKSNSTTQQNQTPKRSSYLK